MPFRSAVAKKLFLNSTAHFLLLLLLLPQKSGTVSPPPIVAFPPSSFLRLWGEGREVRGGEGRKEESAFFLPSPLSLSLFLFPLLSVRGKATCVLVRGRTISQIKICVSSYSFPPLLSIQPEFEKKPKYTCTSFALHDRSHNLTPDLPHPCDFSARCCKMMWSKLCLLGFDTFLGILK